MKKSLKIRGSDKPDYGKFFATHFFCRKALDG